MVDGRRDNRDGKICPRVESAEESLKGRNSLELARRGKLDDRGPETGEGDLGGGVEG